MIRAFDNFNFMRREIVAANQLKTIITRLKDLDYPNLAQFNSLIS